jgi:NAD(P)-dependent dehydrogenase (short-subunit alcohol dehydrogenase family)
VESLRAQRTLVTGAGGALGSAVCTALFAAGAKVIAADRLRTSLDSLRAELSDHDRLDVAEFDASASVHVEALFDAVERAGGPLSAVVHCIGAYAHGSLMDTPDSVVAAMLEANFFSAARVMRAALRRMQARGNGRIVVVCALAAEGPSPDAAAYGASKAALAHLVRSTATAARSSGVTVNAVLPGTMNTAANRAAMPTADASQWVTTTTVARAIAGLLGPAGDGVTGSLLRLPHAGAL